MARKPRQLPAAPLAAGPASAPPVGTGTSVPDRIDEQQVREQFIRGLVLAGAPLVQIEALAMQPPQYQDGKRVGGGLSMTRTQVRLLVADLRALALEERQLSERTSKAEQLSRLRNDLMRMHSERKVPWSTIGSHEKLIAEIEGNLAPRRFQVEVSPVPEALAAVIASMTPDECEQALAEELERERRLRSIDVHGEASPSP